MARESFKLKIWPSEKLEIHQRVNFQLGFPVTAFLNHEKIEISLKHGVTDESSHSKHENFRNGLLHGIKPIFGQVVTRWLSERLLIYRE